MVVRRQWLILFVFILMLSFFLAACERPLPGNQTVPSAPTREAAGEAAYPSATEELQLAEAEQGAAYPGNEVELPLVAEAPDANVASAYPTENEASAVVEETVNEADAEPEETAAGASEGQAVEETTEVVEGETEETSADEVVDVPVGEPEGEATEGAVGDTAAVTAAGDDAASVEETAAGSRTHFVSTGENLFQIGLQYGMSWVVLARANDLPNPDAISVGQELIIPTLEELEAGIEAASEGSEAAEESAQESEEVIEESEAEAGDQQGLEDGTISEVEVVTYIVQRGETLYSIAYKFGLTIDVVAEANDLVNANQIFAGQELIIPNQETAAGLTHEVLAGETIFGVAFAHGIAWTELVLANELASPYVLETGMVLIIPADE